MWSPEIGEKLLVQCEVDNIQDDFAVAILKNNMIVGHVEISRVCWYFLQKNSSKLTCIVSGSRRRSGSSVRLHFQRKTKHLDWMITVFAKLKA